MSTIAVDEVPSPLRDNRDISLSDLVDRPDTDEAAQRNLPRLLSSRTPKPVFSSFAD
jgi:hypothetical protein